MDALHGLQGGQILSGAGKAFEGFGALSAGNYNRDAYEEQAQDELRTSNAQALIVRDRARKAIGEQAAAQGSNGFQVGTGTALDALHESQVNAALDVLEVQRQGQARANAYRTRGAIEATKGRNALVGALLGGAKDIYAMNQDWASAKAPYGAGPTPSGGDSDIYYPAGKPSYGSSLVDPRRYGKTAEPWMNY